MNLETTGNKKMPTIDLKKTGQNILKMRKEAGISVRELQVMFGFRSPQAIYNWQNGISLPSVDNFIVLAAVLGTTIEEIIAIEGEDSDSDEETMIYPQILS
jgi:transcriptional regulator with XRE-family HTH domain